MATEITTGIVLKKMDYSDTSIIVKILTREHGLKSFLFPGGKRKAKKGNILQPLTIVEVCFYQRSDSDLAKISAIEPVHIYKTIPFDPYKSSVVFFMAEVIQKTIHENESDEALFNYLENQLLILDESPEIANFPLKFLIQYPRFLGFELHEEKEARFFDYQEASFVKNQPNHPYFMNAEKTELLLRLKKLAGTEIGTLKIELNLRRILLNELLKMYQVFFDNFKELKSLAVLEATLH